MAKINQGPTVLISLIVILTPLLIIAKRKDRPLTSKGALNVIAIVLHLSRKDVRLNLALSRSLSLSLSLSFSMLLCRLLHRIHFPLSISHFPVHLPHSKSMLTPKEKNRFDPMQLA